MLIQAGYLIVLVLCFAGGYVLGYAYTRKTIDKIGGCPHCGRPINTKDMIDYAQGENDG